MEMLLKGLATWLHLGTLTLVYILHNYKVGKNNDGQE